MRYPRQIVEGMQPMGVPAAVLTRGAAMLTRELTRSRPDDSAAWTVTVYYTAVEAYHSGPPTPVVGCPTMDCAHGTTDLGTYPVDFVAAVRAEGAGRTVTGRYLNWSYDVGFWLDHVPRDAYGQPLRPFESAAADPAVLAAGTRFSIVDCGHEADGGPVPAVVCARLRQARWTVNDQLTPGFGGPHHVDVYIGEETGPAFTESPWYCTLSEAILRVTLPGRQPTNW
jgi:hypothetical protein